MSQFFNAEKWFKVDWGNGVLVFIKAMHDGYCWILFCENLNIWSKSSAPLQMKPNMDIHHIVDGLLEM